MAASKYNTFCIITVLSDTLPLPDFFCTHVEFVHRCLRSESPSQAARQSLAVLMASAVVVLKHETSTLRQCHNLLSIDFKFGVGDNVREVTNPEKVGSDPISGRDATWSQHIRVL